MVAQLIMEKTSTRLIVDLLRKLSNDTDGSQTRNLHNSLLDELQKVTVVDLHRRMIGDKGIVALGKALQDCPVPRLERLSLEHNGIGQDGVAAIGAAIGCGNLTSLKVLHLSWNKIGEQGCVKLVDGFLGNKTPKPSKEIAVKNNFSFEIWNTKKKSKSRNLAYSGSLNKDSADYSQDFSDDTIGMKAFKTTPNLQTLWLSGNSIGDAGMKALANAFETGHCPALKVLRLFKNEIRADGAQALAKVLETRQLAHLEALNLGQNPIGVEGTRSLVTALHSHNVVGLKEVGLSLIPTMAGEGCSALARAVKEGHLPALEALYLHKNGVGNSGAIALGKALASGHAKQLKILDLEGNHIQGAAGVGEIVNVLRVGHVPNLEILDLMDNSIGPEGGKVLGEAFHNRNNMSLKWLALDGNTIGDGGCIALAKALEQDHMSGLQRLHLGNNGIGFKGVAALAKAFEKGKLPELMYVSVDNNGLDHRSVIVLVGALKNNSLPGLKSLNIRRNAGGDREKAADVITAVYVKNKDLKTEILYDWPTDKYAEQVKKVMQERNSVTIVDDQDEDSRCFSCTPRLGFGTRRRSNEVALDGGKFTPRGSFRDPRGSQAVHNKTKFCDVSPLERPPS